MRGQQYQFRLWRVILETVEILWTEKTLVGPEATTLDSLQSAPTAKPI